VIEGIIPSISIFRTWPLPASLRKPIPAHLAPPIVSAHPPVAPGTFINQAVERRTTSHYRDVAPKPHLAAPIPGRTPVPFGTFVYAAQRARQLIRREGRVRLPALGSPPPVPRGTFVYQALPRTTERRYRDVVSAPRLAPGIIGRPIVPAGTFVYQAVERRTQSRYRDIAPAPHLPRAIVGQTPVPPGTFIYVARSARQLIRREGRVRLPSLGSPPPVPKGTFVYQAIPRTTERRYRDVPPSPHLAPPASGRFPVAPGIFVGQAVQRPLTRRTVPKPHLAPPIVPAALPPVQPGTFVYQAVERRRGSRYRDVVPAPHVAPYIRGRTPVRPGTTFIYQALRRPYVGRKVPQRPVIPPVVSPFVPPPPGVAPPILITQRGVTHPAERGADTMPYERGGLTSPRGTRALAQTGAISQGLSSTLLPSTTLLPSPTLLLGGYIWRGGAVGITNPTESTGTTSSH
jgi:hypothetical protein